MRLDLVKGFETSLVIDRVDDSIKENGFLADSYVRAKEALQVYVSQADNVRREIRKEKTASGINDCLYRSPQNIIVFSGRRGTGKTSAMLSFSQSLGMESSIVRAEALQNRDVVIMDPIDPTMLENNQNILNVVLSRLLFKAEEVWKQSMDYNRRYQDKEKEKNEILSVAKRCLNGIAAIKNRSSMETLADLQKIGDSAILKRDFFELVDLLIHFSLSSVNSTSNYPMPLLVLQIDDTDCQIDKGYQVMEDIRKYLTIPNIVIFMAADIDMMRWVFTQHYAEEFDSCLKKEFFKKEETMHYADKYMAKMIPPTHKIYLPVVDEIIRDKADKLELGYYEAEDTDKKNNLLKKGNGFQSKVLNFIYQKTHLVFSAHDAYLNNIVPTTLRGLTYFMNILGSMEDVPEIDNSRIDDTSYLIEALDKQLPILEKNLDIFEEYFMNDWIQAKLSHEMIEIMKKIANQVPEERISYSYNEFNGYYKMKQADKTLHLDPEREKMEKPTYYDLDYLLQRILGTLEEAKQNTEEVYRQPEDFYNVFSIRTLLSIKNNKDILKVKREAINEAKNPVSPVIIKSKEEKSSLPRHLYLDDKEFDTYKLVSGGRVKECNFTDALSAPLFAKSTDSLKGDSQKRIFQLQEMSALIASNFEVQEVIRKVIKKQEPDPELANMEFYDTQERTVEVIFKEIQKAILNMNDNMLTGEKRENVNLIDFSYFPPEIIQQKQQSAFEKINDLLVEIKNNYPKLKGQTREEEIGKKLKLLGKEIEVYKFYSDDLLLEKYDKLPKELWRYKFVFDKEDNLKDEEKFLELICRAEKFRDKIKKEV